MTYLDEFAQELTQAGVRGRVRHRILAEFSDHLTSDPQADLGRPADLARQFADDLGTRRIRRAALVGFGALAIAGALALAVFAATAHAGIALPKVHPPSRVLFDLGMALVAFGGQVALVAGVLAALRALRRRTARVIVREEAIVVRRRTAVALVAGLACLVGLAVVGLQANHAAGWWRVLALASAGAGVSAIAVAFVPLMRALEVLPLTDGSAGDIFDDLGALVPAPLRGRPRGLALLVAGGIVVILAVAGVLQDDPYDGALRGLVDGIACLAGFALLGSYLGLRPSRA